MRIGARLKNDAPLPPLAVCGRPVSRETYFEPADVVAELLLRPDFERVEVTEPRPAKPIKIFEKTIAKRVDLETKDD